MINNFERLGINENLLEIINEQGFENPTKIQTRAMPLALTGEDLIINSATGTGKTLIYAITIIQTIQATKGIQALIVLPTKELAKQVNEVIKLFSKDQGLNITLAVGDSNYKNQRSIINESEIVIATPGRIADFISQDVIDFSNLKILVLDEVDSIFKSDFKDDLVSILKAVPRYKQSLVFSATISKEDYLTIKPHLKNPRRITVEKEVSPKNLKQTYYEVQTDQKLSLLAHLLETERAGLSLVFVNRQDNAEFIQKNLKHLDLEIDLIHGDMTQGKRNKIIENFRNQKFDVLIATDVAARGLDVEGITHVYNYNIPQHFEKYIHRIGRTARAGNSGKVINFISKADIKNFVLTTKKFNISLLRKDLPEFNLIETKKPLKKKKY